MIENKDQIDVSGKRKVQACCLRFAQESALEIVMKRLVAATAAAFVVMLGCAYAAPFLSEQQARAKEVNILKGDPYGRTPDEVAKNIRQIRFVQDGNTKACGARKIPAWEFHVVVVTADKDQFNNRVIDGFLAVDARTGKILCANLQCWTKRDKLKWRIWNSL